MNTIITTALGDAKPAPLIPLSLKPFFNETPVLWYEDSDSYDILVGEVLAELDPQDKIAFLLCKDVADYIWEIGRLKRLRREAIYAQIPAVLWDLISDLYFQRNNPGGFMPVQLSLRPKFITRIRRMLTDRPEARAEFAEFLNEYDVEPGILHYATFTAASNKLAILDATRERAERHRDRLLQSFANRKHSLASQARSLIARHEVSDVEVEIVNSGAPH